MEYLLDNFYFKVGDSLFRQIIGIPMGSDPAPYFANLYLYYYARKWILNLKKTDLAAAHNFRFIDYLIVINDRGDFERNMHNIYPVEMEVSKENSGFDAASFLDLQISITDNKFDLCLYDKRVAFPFSIVRMPYRSSNIPVNMLYSSIGAEILRIARATTVIPKFF